MLRLVSSSTRHSTLGSTAGSQNVQKHVTEFKKFEDIPGPKSYPFIGTLHKYLPFIGKQKQPPIYIIVLYYNDLQLFATSSASRRIMLLNLNEII